MLLLKRTSAWDELSELVERDENRRIESSLFKLYDAISGAGKTDAFDDVMDEEFPDGVETHELEDFFKAEQDFILEELGIDKQDGDEDDDDEDDDEDYSNDED